MIKIFLFLIRFYKALISPFLGPCCRFYPTCSDYGCEALQKYGCLKGLFLLMKRLLKCGFWHPGGYDPP